MNAYRRREKSGRAAVVLVLSLKGVGGGCRGDEDSGVTVAEMAGSNVWWW